MSEEQQQLFNIFMAIAGFLGGWLLNNMWAIIKDLQSRDKEISDKLASIEVVVAGEYVKRDEMEKSFNIVFAKLDKISDELYKANVK